MLFLFLHGWPGLGRRMSHGGFPSELSSSSFPGGPRITLGSQGKRTRRGRCGTALGRGRDTGSAHTGFLPSRGRTRSMHVWEKGNGGQPIWMVREAVQQILNLICFLIKIPCSPLENYAALETNKGLYENY